MSTLHVNTVETSSGGPVTLTKQISLKHYSEQNNSTPTVNESFNQSSLTDDGTGNFTHNFTNSFNTITYLIIQGGCGNRGSTTGSLRGEMPDGTFTSSAAPLRYAYATGNAYDDTQAGVAFVGDLA